MAYEKTMPNLIMCYQRIRRMRSAIGRSRKSVVSAQHLFSTKPTNTERNLAKPNETKQNQTKPSIICPIYHANTTIFNDLHYYFSQMTFLVALRSLRLQCCRVSINTDRTTAQRPHSTTAQSVVVCCRRAVRSPGGYRLPLA